MNNEEWDMASDRLNCNKSFGYHCVPNKYLTSLIEFCYPRGYSLLFKEGNLCSMVKKMQSRLSKIEICLLYFEKSYDYRGKSIICRTRVKKSVNLS